MGLELGLAVVLEEEEEGDRWEALLELVPGMAIPKATKLTLFFLVCMFRMALEI